MHRVMDGSDVVCTVRDYAVASLHRQRMDAERAIPAWQLLTQECWYLLGLNPSWNPQT